MQVTPPHMEQGTCENGNGQIPCTELGPRFLSDLFCVIVQF